MKKVLIISYYWPPSGGIGVLRNLKLAKYLRMYGWEPVLLVPEGADYPGIDHSNEKDIPINLEILRCKIWEPYGLYRKITGKKADSIVNNVFYTNEEKSGIMHKISVWIRSNFFIPDARCFWIKPAVQTAMQYLNINKVDAIFSDGPPHTNTRIATIIKQKTNIPWLADFQDPWTQVDYYQMLKLTGWGDRKHKLFEQEAFQHANAITIVSKAWKLDLEKIGAKNVSVAYWGFDPDDYTHLENIKCERELFTITHTGILGHDRNPTIFLSVLADMVKQDREFAQKLCIQFIGQVDFSIKEAVTLHGLDKNTRYSGNVTRAEAILKIKSSVVLLLLLNQQKNSAGRVPGKLFEYLAVRRPILCLGHSNGDTAELISKSASGSTFEYDDTEGIKSQLKNLWQSYKAGSIFEPIESTISQYSVQNTVKLIAEKLNSISGK